MCLAQTITHKDVPNSRATGCCLVVYQTYVTSDCPPDSGEPLNDVIINQSVNPSKVST